MIRVATVARAVLVHLLKLMLAATRRPIIVRRASGKSVHCPHAIGPVRLDGGERDIEAGDELDSECSQAGAQRDVEAVRRRGIASETELQLVEPHVALVE